MLDGDIARPHGAHPARHSSRAASCNPPLPTTVPEPVFCTSGDPFLHSVNLQHSPGVKQVRRVNFFIFTWPKQTGLKRSFVLGRDAFDACFKELITGSRTCRVARGLRRASQSRCWSRKRMSCLSPPGWPSTSSRFAHRVLSALTARAWRAVVDVLAAACGLLVVIEQAR